MRKPDLTAVQIETITISIAEWVRNLAERIRRIERMHLMGAIPIDAFDNLMRDLHLVADASETLDAQRERLTATLDRIMAVLGLAPADDPVDAVAKLQAELAEAQELLSTADHFAWGKTPHIIDRQDDGTYTCIRLPKRSPMKAESLRHNGEWRCLWPEVGPSPYWPTLSLLCAELRRQNLLPETTDA